MCGSALLSAVTCLASSKAFINLTSQIHTLCALFILSSFVFLVKGPIEIFLVNRIEDLLKQLCEHFYALHDFGGAGESRRSVTYDTSQLIVEEKFLSFALLFVLIGTLLFRKMCFYILILE